MAHFLTMGLLITVFANCILAHRERPFSSLSESEQDDVEMYRRNNDEEEGIPIELPKTSRSTTPSTTTRTTTTGTTRILPPLDPRFRRIYNPDETATIVDYPFMAALLVNKQLWCGGIIIDTDKVLTAAHCLQLQYNNRFFREYVKMLTIRVGSNNATAGGEVVRVTELDFHPNYKPDTLEFNIAVMRLHRNLTFDKSDSSVSALEYTSNKVVSTDQNVSFLGWGSVLSPAGKGGLVLLQKVDLPIYDLADCQDKYGRDLVTRSNFCAGFISEKKNVCNHDAGGPAILNNQVVGILSFSSKRCDTPDQPAVFTNVGMVADWLDTVGKKK